ncbi:MAG: peroxiredoxin Q/BCP [Saprospiraceae bacterium]|jgi:peroxiredoxin Q/BCP
MALKVGDKAPDFTGVNEKNEIISLSDYKGKKLILFFYPKDNTPGCTAAACDLRDNYAELQKQGFELLGVSPDGPKKHAKFIEKFEFPFPLLADEDKVVLNAFDAWGLKKFMGREYDGVLRSTYIIDENGIISHVIEKVKTKTHASQIMELVA